MKNQTSYLLFYDFAGLEARAGLPVPMLGLVGSLGVPHQLLQLQRAKEPAGRQHGNMGDWVGCKENNWIQSPAEKTATLWQSLS